MKIHNFIKDTKGMAQIELDALKKQESVKANEQDAGAEPGESAEEKPGPKKRKKKAQAETQGVL